MRAFGIITLCIVLIIGGGIAWCNRPYPTYTYRYRMTIEVSVDGAVRTGSSVIEIRLDKRGIRLPESSAVTTVVAGEAVFVDLGGGRNLVALLASGPNASGVDFPQRVIPAHFSSSYSDDDLARLPTLRGSWDLPQNQIPTLVTFSDLNDPKTARVVGLGEFEQVFGPNVHFNRAWIEMTNDPVTKGIEKKLKWWNNPGRPASEARRAWLAGDTTGPSIEPEMLFIKRD